MSPRSPFAAVLGFAVASWWTARALRAVRSQLARHALAPIVVPLPPSSFPPHGSRAMTAVLRLSRATCLERATVLQAWHLDNGRPRDVVIGVRAGEEFGAHAWLDGQPAGSDFAELLRRPPEQLVLRR